MLIETIAALSFVITATAATAQAQPKPVPAEPPPAARPATPMKPPAAAPTPQPTDGAEEIARLLPAQPQRQVEGQPLNIKLEITITDQGAPGEPSRKTVSMVIADRAAGSIRTGGTPVTTASRPQPIAINVDATPAIQRDGSIRLQFGLEYQPRPGTDPVQPTANLPRMATVNQRLTVIVQDGKPLQISQAADAGSDGRVTVEIKATILK